MDEREPFEGMVRLNRTIHMHTAFEIKSGLICFSLIAAERPGGPRRRSPHRIPCFRVQAVPLSMPCLSKGLCELRQGLEQVGDETVVGDLEDRGFLVLVDGDDDL